jgi:site-specific DNA-methyltransferase (adenine-specific)
MIKTKLIHGDCLEKLKELPDCSVDSVVTDPPYGLSFMGKKWDYDVPSVEIWAECLRVLKPGGHVLSFGGSRTYHRMACAIEDAGFEVRDQIMWVYGSGFPKSHNISKAIDKKGDKTEEWDGWGTALKPAHEPIVLARKPLEGTVVDNIRKWGVGGLNIDGCRVANNGEQFGELPNRGGRRVFNTDGQTFQESGYDYKAGDLNREAVDKLKNLGRFPANLMHDGSDEVVGLFPMTGASKSTPRNNGEFKSVAKGRDLPHVTYGHEDNGGSAARFFYCAKASKKDREGSTHPTMKPTDLMRYLCRLVTPPEGIVLDPFMGSGSTGKAAVIEGFNFIGIEREESYMEIAEARINPAKTPA